MSNIIKLLLIFSIAMLSFTLNAQRTYILGSNFENYIETQDSFGNISFFNINDGEQVKGGNLFTRNNTINITNFSKGVYFIRITSNTNSFIEKILIK